jgi:prolyl 4-hydroxylase
MQPELAMVSATKKGFIRSPHHQCSDRYFMMFKNHTDEGFLVTKAPDVVREQISAFWHNNKHRIREERWPAGATEMNHWESPSFVVKVGEQKGLRGGGNDDLKMIIQSETHRQVEEWLGFDVVSTAMYGIRVHTRRTVVPPHVVRPPKSISATLNVAQDLDESWVFELYQRDGSAVNVTLEPGGLLMFESGSLIHGVSTTSPVSMTIKKSRPNIA